MRLDLLLNVINITHYFPFPQVSTCLECHFKKKMLRVYLLNRGSREGWKSSFLWNGQQTAVLHHINVPILFIFLECVWLIFSLPFSFLARRLFFRLNTWLAYIYIYIFKLSHLTYNSLVETWTFLIWVLMNYTSSYLTITDFRWRLNGWEGEPMISLWLSTQLQNIRPKKNEQQQKPRETSRLQKQSSKQNTFEEPVVSLPYFPVGTGVLEVYPILEWRFLVVSLSTFVLLHMFHIHHVYTRACHNV